MAIRFPLRLMWSPCGSGLSGRLGEEGPHERLELLPVALGPLVLAPLPLADGEGHGDVLLALLAVELVVGHGRSSSLLGSRSRPTAPGGCGRFRAPPSIPGNDRRGAPGAARPRPPRASASLELRHEPAPGAQQPRVAVPRADQLHAEREAVGALHEGHTERGHAAQRPSVAELVLMYARSA